MAEDYDTERMAGILQTSENRKNGLEMAIRMQPASNQNPALVTLEGYRFVLQPSGKGQAKIIPYRKNNNKGLSISVVIRSQNGLISEI